MSALIKICGVKTEEIAIEAARRGAGMLGFVFYPKSPRYISPEDAERIVTEVKRASEETGFEAPRFAGLFVDGGEKALAEAAPFLTHFQFHGHESPERCSAMSAEFGVEVLKAIPVSEAGDIAGAKAFVGAADMLIFDSRPAKGADRPGGHGAKFDWSLVAGYAGETPFLLAGGLDAKNVGAAIKAARKSFAFAGVDVSSGVETRPGEKDAALVAEFIEAARTSF